MEYYKNIEISEEYKVSRATVTRWLENTLEGKNSLQTIVRNNKVYVIKNAHNQAELQKLKEQGFSKRNKTGFSQIEPDDEFLSVFTNAQQIEIINNIKIRKEIPLKFTYINGGAQLWKEVSKEVSQNGTAKAFELTPQLLNIITPFLLSKSSKFDKINLIDLGPGDVVNTKKIIDSFLESGKLDKYVAFDISKEMLEITRQSVNSWYSDINYSEFIIDFEKDRFGEILTNLKKGSNSINILLFLGNSFGNVQDETVFFKNIQYSLDDEDIFVVSNRLAGYNDVTNWEYMSSRNQRHLFILRMIGIDTDECEIVFKYNDANRTRNAYLKLDKDYLFKSDVATFNLYKNEEIKIWHHKMNTPTELSELLNITNMEKCAFLTSNDLSHYILACENSRRKQIS